MGAFDHLIPAENTSPASGAGTFDHLIPKAATKPRKRTFADNVTGFMATVNANIPLADEAAAGLNTAANLMTGRAQLSDIRGDFEQSMTKQRGFEAGLREAHPKTAALARGTGMAATAAAPTGPLTGAFVNGSRAGNMVRGAMMASGSAGLNAAADRGTLGERATAMGGAMVNPAVLALGAAGGAIAPALAKPRTTSQTDAQTLKDIGVSTSIPQKMGTAAKQVEDLMMRFPIVGQAISGSRTRQIEQLNRGVGLKALESIGERLPKEIKPGFEMVQYVDDRLSRVYDEAADLVPAVTLDKQLNDDFAKISQRTVDLPESEAAQFARIISDRTERLQDGATGEMVKQIHGELGGLQAEAARKGSATLSTMIGDTRRAMMGLIARANPEAGALIDKADDGWAIYSIMNDAAAAATNRGGVYLPGQLNTQVGAAAKSMGSNMKGKGRGPMQEIATAATRMIPDSYGNPGTANAALVSGGGVGLMTAPTETLVAAGAATAAATPYFLMARKVAEELPPTASPGQIRKALAQIEELASLDPAVDDLRRQVAAKLGVGGGGAIRPRGPAVEVYIPGHPEAGYGASYAPNASSR